MQNDEAKPGAAQSHGFLKLESETRWLQFSFLAPLLLSIAAIVATIVTVNYAHQRRELQLGVVHLRTSAARLYEESMLQNTRALHTLMDVLERDETLRDALARKDRQVLLEQSSPLFEDMKRNYGITHFYFTGPDRVNLLRVHQPSRHGDVIDRVTTLNAERSGAVSSGIELGPLGLFTLRLVSPWYDTRTRKLLGYVELGMEIDKILQNVHALFGVEVFVLIRKDLVQRAAWEEGMRVLGRTPDWGRFPDAVLSVQGAYELPAELVGQFREFSPGDASSTLETSCNGHPCHVMLIPLFDVGGRAVARMAMLVDTSQQVADARQAVMIGSIASVISGSALFVFFYWLVGRIGRRIERNERMLSDLASRDGLTGLYNHRMFYSLLEDEIARTHRYKRSVAMLMLDIDHFKRVNDTYGHVTGDRILEGLAKVLEETVRQEDRVCRYGGEEIAVILPEANTATAMQSAERLRAAIEDTVFEDDNGQEVKITVSIGVASLPDQVATLQDLVTATDAALYAAKESGRNRVCSYEKTAGISLGVA